MNVYVSLGLVCADLSPYTAAVLSATCEEKECCICKPHEGFKNRQYLHETRKLLDIYRALSSSAYLLQCGVSDPILESFRICRRIENLKEEYPAYQVSHSYSTVTFFTQPWMEFLALLRFRRLTLFAYPCFYLGLLLSPFTLLPFGFRYLVTIISLGYKTSARHLSSQCTK